MSSTAGAGFGGWRLAWLGFVRFAPLVAEPFTQLPPFPARVDPTGGVQEARKLALTTPPVGKLRVAVETILREVCETVLCVLGGGGKVVLFERR